MDTEAMYQRYVLAGAIRRDPGAVAELFTADGVLESPLVPAGHPFPPRLAGRDAIRRGLADYYARSTPRGGTVDGERSSLVLHHAGPDTLIAELDAAFTDAPPVSMVQVFRFRDGLIAHLRDYFHPDALG
ncbi:nuclear transport factor 2 family protein [Cryptosporangium japonicum]|uniref:SnoaL-like domain-containing protein n=1 Tax=Cryptosporangium japonicum TaxID=80872 RepID=A0ABP3E5B0_9ACTN